MRNKFTFCLSFALLLFVLVSCDLLTGSKTLNSKEVTFIVEPNSTLSSLATKLKKKKLKLKDEIESFKKQLT